VQILEGQTHGSQRVPDAGCEQFGKEQSTQICDYFTCAQAGLRSGIVVKEKYVFLVSVRTKCTNTLSQFA
jgi:hypothetical protein